MYGFVVLLHVRTSSTATTKLHGMSHFEMKYFHFFYFSTFEWDLNFVFRMIVYANKLNQNENNKIKDREDPFIG